MKKTVVSILSALIAVGITTTTLAQSTGKEAKNRFPDVGFLVNILAHGQTTPVELKNFVVNVTGNDYNFQYQASAVSHKAGTDEVRFTLTLPAAAFNQDLTLKASFEYPGKPVCNITADKPVKVEQGKKIWVFWNIEPADCTGKITKEKPQP